MTIRIGDRVALWPADNARTQVVVLVRRNGMVSVQHQKTGEIETVHRTFLFAVGDWVEETGGLCRTGLVYCVNVHGVVVQFGSSGPHELISAKVLRKADPGEVAYVMGCRVRDLPPELWPNDD